MKTTINWLLHIEASNGDDEQYLEDAFVEIQDEGLPEADEIAIRPGRAAMRFVSSTHGDGRISIWTREGLELLHTAVGEYLKAVKEREG